MPKPVSRPVRHLWLLRHGKAASDAPWGGSDRERPLTARGRRDATALGERIVKAGTGLGLDGVKSPEVVICSAAVRTRQTAELVVKAMGEPVPLDSYRSLYGADVDDVLQYVREIDEGVRSALVVGHNPTIFEVVWDLLGDSDEGGGARDRSLLEAHGFPTCSLAVVTLHVADWGETASGRGNLAGVFKPPY